MLRVDRRALWEFHGDSQESLRRLPCPTAVMDEYAASVATLVGMLGIDAGQAGTLLQNAGGNIEAAASEYFYMMEEGGGTDGETDGASTDMDEDEDMAMAMAPPPTMARPTAKRPKLEARPAPRLGLDAAGLAALQAGFALSAAPADGADALHRAALLSGAAEEDGLSLYGDSGESDLVGLLKASAAAAPFVTAVATSLSLAEQESVYGPALESLLRRLDPYSGGAVESGRLRSGEWTGREAEGLGVLRLLSPSPAGLTGQRVILTAALFKDPAAKAAALRWLGAVLAANGANADGGKQQSPQEAMRARQSGASGGAAAVLLQLCGPFLTPTALRDGKGHDGFARLDWRLTEAGGDPSGGGGAGAGGSGGFEESNEEADELAQADQALPLTHQLVDASIQVLHSAQAIKLSLLSSSDAAAEPAPPPNTPPPAGAAGGSAEGVAAGGGDAEAELHFAELHFVTECFFLCLRALHVGVLPAMRGAGRRLPAMRRCERILLELQRKGGAAAFDAHLHAIKEAGQGKAQAAVLAYRLLLDGPRLQPLLLRFCGLAGAGLEHLWREARGSSISGESAAAADACAALPASTLTDVFALLVLFARKDPQALVASEVAAPLVSRCACRWALASSPFVRFTAAELLETLVQMDEHAARLAGSRLRGVAGPLVRLIDAEAASEVQLPLLSLYVELGLHTNAAAVSDKNGDRFRIMSVLRALWQQPQPWRALQAAAAASLEPGGGGDGGAAFGEFAETLVKEAVFLLADALGRLADVHTRQEEMPASVRRGDKAASLPAPPPASAADKEKEAAWAALSGKERQAREARLEQCRRTAKGFLQLAHSSLAALLFLTDEAGVCSAFASHPSRASKLAAMLVEFLRKLCDVKAREGLRVDQPDKLGWHPKKMRSDTRPHPKKMLSDTRTHPKKRLSDTRTHPKKMLSDTRTHPKKMLSDTAQLLLHAASRVPAFVQTLAACDNLDVPLLHTATNILEHAFNR
ncbi:hypothetical protein EMIHUDRAFT_225987 [Emiliania huxleyi CCMP1516]|uniref:Ubiquitin conjugation factor E4 core domain-containing protein n=2 Tax=Emiliania huxleyi TaxID=2903 RepID=A0A0D3KMM8_EMIH1|nr:hypothetical protein EMIHUDRAFT_225987 [Emiliania huxleyi CCMP1516]EOD37013.1 hypothetical protein EMIHUDRAFT_225987 [Emiliania huxleyi CCMP1516]|eukprot:XP_005789442.1 hypothetical protein EMIHUDRAFT_225987 [Emiliania huxleyi CCMP1516]